ncbi:MAG TPA: YciI family protein [Longimicrobiales bacterium]
MRYMMIVSGSENLAASGPPPAELMEAIERLGEEAAREGTLVSFGGLKPTSSGVRMRIRNGEIITTDGPFTESKEVIGGFSIFDFASKEEAIEEARKLMELHRVHWPNWEGVVEIRPMYDENDDVRATQIEASRRLQDVGGIRGHDPL